MKRRIPVAALLAVIMLLGLTATSYAKDTAKLIDGNKAIKGKLAPRFSIKTLSGEEFNIDTLRGNKPIVISFWATWCGPCKKELPYLEKFYEKYKDSCEVIAISIDSEKDRKVLDNNIKELKLGFKIANDSGDKLKKLYPRKGIPYLIVIRKNGEIAQLKFGAPKPDTLVEELEELLGADLKPAPKATPKVK